MESDGRPDDAATSVPERRGRFQRARPFLNMVALGAVILFLGPCAARIATVPLVPPMPGPDWDETSDPWADYAWRWWLIEHLPTVVAVPGLLLAALGTYRFARSGLVPGEARRLSAGAAVAFAGALGLLSAVVVETWIGDEPSGPWSVVVLAARFGPMVWLALYARSLQRVSKDAELPTPFWSWAFAFWLTVATLAFLLLTVLVVGWNASDESGRVQLHGAAVVVIGLGGVVLPLATTVSFLLAASATHRTLRTVRRGEALRRGDVRTA